MFVLLFVIFNFDFRHSSIFTVFYICFVKVPLKKRRQWRINYLAGRYWTRLILCSLGVCWSTKFHPSHFWRGDKNQSQASSRSQVREWNPGKVTYVFCSFCWYLFSSYLCYTYFFNIVKINEFLILDKKNNKNLH